MSYYYSGCNTKYKACDTSLDFIDDGSMSNYEKMCFIIAELKKLTEIVNNLSCECPGNFNVQDFGVTGDGFTDDTEKINEIFKGGNKTICLPEGNYLIKDHIRVYPNTTIKMHEKCVILNDNQISEYVFVNGELLMLNEFKRNKFRDPSQSSA